MITAKNLQKAGFISGDRKKYLFGAPPEAPIWYRVWLLEIKPYVEICVTEHSNGQFIADLQMFEAETALNLTTVTELITLAKLLK